MNKIILTILTILILFPASVFAETVGFFSKIEGRVDILKEGAARAASINVNDPVSLGDIVRTKSDGKAEITFKDDTTVRVAPESRLKIDEYAFNPDNTRNKGILNLFRGKIRAVVSKSKAIIPIGATSSSFDVNTPTAIAGVRGTDLFVFHDRGVTGVIFKEGQGFVVNPNVPERVVNVSAGQVTFVVKPDAPPLPPRPASNIELAVHAKDTAPQEKPKEKKEEGDKQKEDKKEIKEAKAGDKDKKDEGKKDEGKPAEEKKTAEAAPAAEAAAPVDINAAVAETAASVDIATASTSIETLTTSDGTAFGYTAPTETIIPDIISPIDSAIEPPIDLPITEAIPDTLDTSTLPPPPTPDAFIGLMYPDDAYYPSYCTYNCGNFASLPWDTHYTNELTQDGYMYGGFAGIDSFRTGPAAFYATGAYSNPNNKPLWFSETEGLVADGSEFYGFTSGINLSNYLEGGLVAIYIRPDGTTGFIKSSDILGFFDPAYGIWAASGTLLATQMGTTYIPPTYLYAGSPYLDYDKDDFGYIGGDISGSIAVESVNLIDQNWGIWAGYGGGHFSALPPQNWTAKVGGETYDDYAVLDGYFLGSVSGTEWTGGKLKGTVSGRFLSKYEFGQFDGKVIGVYDAATYQWQADSLGTYTETPLDFSGDVYGGLLWYDPATYGGALRYANTDPYDQSWNVHGIIGGIGNLWTAGNANVYLMGNYTTASGSATLPYLVYGSGWHLNYDPTVSGYSSTIGGAFSGYTVGLWNNGAINSNTLAIYIDPNGNAGYLSGPLSGNYYTDINMWEMNGILSTEFKETTGILPADLAASLNTGGFGWYSPQSIYMTGDFGGSGGISSTYFEGSLKGLSGLNWGIWNSGMGGSYTGAVGNNMTAKFGGSNFFDTNGNYGYLLGDITSNDWGTSGSTFTGIVNAQFMTPYLLGSMNGNAVGAFDGTYWESAGIGKWNAQPLSFSGKVMPDGNTNVGYPTGAGLYSYDTWSFWLDIEGSSTGLMGGITAPWSGLTNVTYMGTYNVSLGIGYGPPFLWTPEIYSYNANNFTNTTYDGGAYRGFAGGIWNADGTINAKVYSLYVDPSGNAGILKGDLGGNYYPTINMFEADGTWTPIQMITGIGILPADLLSLTNVVSSQYSYSITSLGDFNGFGGINVSGDEMLTYDTWRYSISGQNWGVWKSIIGGDYTGPTADIWSLSTSVNLGQTIYGTKTDGWLWSNGILAGTIYGYGADITTTPNTWISVGETIGTFDVSMLTWQAVQMGAWIDTNKFLAMRQTPEGQAALTQLNIPFVEVGRTNLTGSGTMGGAPVNVYMNDTTFFAYSNGASPKIWATNAVGGDYGCSACGSTTVGLTGANGLGANFNIQTFDTGSGKWTATVDGGGTYTGTGTMNGTAVQFNGAAAGTNTGIGPGTFTGTAAGVAK